MDENPTTPPANDGEPPKNEQQAPADALSRTPEDLEQEQAEQTAATPRTETDAKPGKQPSKIKKFLKRINVYLLMFLLLIVIAGVGMAVYYLNAQNNTPEAPGIATQSLSEETLKQLANTDATVGSASQTLTIQGSAVIAGQTLMRGNLNVAGNLQTGGTIQGPGITISGQANLGETQTNNLQVAGNAAVQGNTTTRDLSVAGTSSFSGAMTASQITTSRLVLSGNASLQVPNHISFTGPTPSRSIASNAIGRGGSVSINGSDTSGTVNINTGNSTVAGCFARINFAQAFSSQPRVIISPVGAAAGQTQYYVDRNTAGFSICTSSPAPANQAFAFDYFVAGQ